MPYALIDNGSFYAIKYHIHDHDESVYIIATSASKIK
jgi:hypothetical protein